VQSAGCGVTSDEVEVTWGAGGREIVGNVQDLDALLDRLDREARRNGRPISVGLTRQGGAGTLSIVVGAGRSLLDHVPEDNDPPYLASVGDEDVDRPFIFYVGDGHYSELPWRHTIPGPQARDAARVFFRTGRLDDTVTWDET
jgi:hypothetical protein